MQQILDESWFMIARTLEEVVANLEAARGYTPGRLVWL